MQNSLARKVVLFSDLELPSRFLNQVGAKERGEISSVAGEKADFFFFYTIRVQGDPPRTDVIIPRDFEVTHSQVENEAFLLGNALKHLPM